MQYGIINGAIPSRKTACLIGGVYQDHELPPSTAEIDRASKGLLKKRLADFDPTLGSTMMVYGIPGVKAERVLLVGLGSKEKVSLSSLRTAGLRAIQALNKTKVSEVTSLLAQIPIEEGNSETADHIKALVEISEYATYRFDTMKSTKSGGARLRRQTFLLAGRQNSRKLSPAIATGLAISKGVSLARDLGNLPANVCTPTYLATEARKLARQYTKLKVKVIGEAEIRRLGMGAFLGVSRGSRETPKLIVFEYNGGTKAQKPFALVGKGITFDAGGISLKPSASMDEMKYDMCGAASVFGSIVAACELGLKINVVGVTPACENLPDGNAVKPGDVLKSMSGQTIEVLNTDAEGRLILADALTYVERFKPQAVVDIATLTGACVIALGHHASGLMSPDDALASDLLAAGERAGDRAWRLPLWEEYQDQLKSNFADFANVGGRPAGSITAGCFLWRFAKNYRWAHLDIAGTAWHSGAKKGGTGRPVSLLVEWLLAAKP